MSQQKEMMQVAEETTPGKMTYFCQEIPKEWHTGVQDAVPWHLFEPFELVDTVTGMQALEQTVVRACWSPNFLFIQFICEDRHIASDFLNRDDPLYEQDVVELFFDEYGNGTHYLELEVSPHNVVFDARIENDGFGNTVRVDKEWDFVGLQTNVYLDAPDRLVYEIQIPAYNFDRPFRAGMQWRANFYRIDENPEGLREYQAWQPTGAVNFHVSDEFGTIQFI
ncbi:carbohydrate-binding family 9-like protein [Paenibacillus sp. LPE1-1-1.1]|uniref:carbohydrate-binding family 9-like protein n=1 Tax=Paenibacillus sp. LPE1-1-1.1 TaxID=3135230 RepID=UPI00343D2B4A